MHHRTNPLIDLDIAEVEGLPPSFTALEWDFPSVDVSKAATAESWRKEIHRPASHTHKWWAQRLGSVFRAILVAAYSTDKSETLHRLNHGLRLKDVKVLDPFAGSGTTLVEAAKLGAVSTGVDINPVATLVQRQALQDWDINNLHKHFDDVEKACRKEIEDLHVDSKGHPVLYYFWVAQVECPICFSTTDLFSNYVFAKHAYPSRFPSARAVCPDCSSITQVDLAKSLLGTCTNGHLLDRIPPVSGQYLTCKNQHRSRVIDALAGNPPTYRMYAKLVLTDSSKDYHPIDDFDLCLYKESERRLMRAEDILRPSGQLEPGYNTRQAMRWGFHRWEQFFNSRQLYSLGILGKAIRDLPKSPEREALCALFSGTLEFNNLFCSFKGEGTGAVRHMFSHHILKPERTPLEAHPWGTTKSSGSFSTLFRSRILRAHTYKNDPHDIVIKGSKTTRRRYISYPLTLKRGSWEVICGDSGELPHDDETFDLVITDPPYFDKVHYSELADFFHSWLKNINPSEDYRTDLSSTRSVKEAQTTDVVRFGSALRRVFQESARVLKKGGLMAFSFHHGTTAAWGQVAKAVQDAGFVMTSLQPVKAEMSSSSTKNGVKEPSNLDAIVVCRLRNTVNGTSLPHSPEEAVATALSRLRTLFEGGIPVGVGDIRSLVTGAVMALSTLHDGPADHHDIAKTAERLAQDACDQWVDRQTPRQITQT